VGFGSDRSVKLTVGATMDGFVNELDRGTRAGQQWSKSLAANAKQAAVAIHGVKNEAKEVAVPLLAIGTVAAAGVAYAVKSYADFDEKMSSVKSLSHATADEQRQLKQAALETGTAIGYSATQAADAEIELVKAGVQANDIYGGALSGSLKLAAAGQIDVADATSIAASTMVQFGLKGRDVTHIADLLAAGADKALGGVSDLGEGLKYIGPVAASSNVSLEQTVGTMSLLAQNGILGQQAGTGLRGVLLSLTAPSKIAADTMNEYGISVYDAQGKFVGFNGAAEQLHKRLGTLGDAERDAALGRIFGNEQITVATILMNGGAEAVDKWTKSVNEQGFATEQALGKMDNLNGDLTKLKATFQTAAIVTGEAADGPLRSAVQVVTDLLDVYNQAPGAVQGVVLGVGVLTAAVALSSGTLLIAVPKVVEFGKALQVVAASNIPGFSTAAGGALKATSALGRGLGAAATFATGPFGLAFAAAALAIHTFDMAASSGAASQKELESAITHTVSAAKLLELAGQRSDLSKFLVGDVAGQLKDIPALLDRTTDGWAQFYSMVSIGGASADQKTQQALKSLRAVGTELGQVAEVNAPAAAKAFNQIVDSQKLSNDQAQKLLSGPFSDYKSELMNQANALGIATDKTNLMLLATGQYDEAASKAKDPTKENADALDELKTSGEGAAQAIEDTANALKNLTSPTLDARDAKRQFQAAVDAVTASVKENGTTLDISTEKGRSNQAALDGIAQSAENAAGAIYTQTGSQEQATAAMEQGRNELIAALGQYGITGQAAQDYADKIIGTPTDWATLFTNTAPAAGENVSSYQQKINALPREKQTEIKAATAVAQEALQNVANTLLGIPAQKTITITTNHVDVATSSNTNGIFKNGKATGGQIVGPGTGTSDDIPIWASNGEWMIRESSASMYGPQIMHAINQGLLSKQQLMASMASARGYASGGQITRSSYAPARTPVVVVPSGGGYDGPLVGNLTVPVPADATVKQTVDEVMFAFRSKVRGGR
jgi:TP901 family phage tail tape measure protein